MRIDTSFTTGVEFLLNKRGARWSVNIRGPFMDTLVFATTIPFSALSEDANQKCWEEIKSLFTDKNYFYEDNTTIKTIEIVHKRKQRWASSLPMKRKKLLT